MALKFRPCIVLYLFFIFLNISKSIFSQSNYPQNIETFYPFALPPIGQSPNSTTNQPLSPPPVPPQPPPPPPLAVSPSTSSSSNNKTVIKAVAATAVSTIVLSALFFLLLQRYTRRRREKVGANSGDGNRVVPQQEFTRFNGNLKGVIVDEEGLDVLYWRNLEGENNKDNFDKGLFNSREDVITKGNRSKKIQQPIQETPLLRGKSSTSQSQVWSQKEVANRKEVAIPPPAPVSVLAFGKVESTPAPPPPPPLLPAKISPAPPPPPPKIGAFASSSSSSSKPPPAPKAMGINNKEGEGITKSGNGQVKLKPLHWDKVNPNVDHSMVWHKIDGGSFRFDDDLMEALFGTIAVNKKSPRKNSNTSSPRSEKPGPPSQIFILDTRKSQNTAIVLRSLAISRKEIINALIDGHGLNSDTLEKLTKIAPTKEEEAEILAFDGDPTRLADAESFLYHLLKAVPSSFTHFNAMLFRSNYDTDILHIKETSQILELACKELRTRGLFFKLLEAVLKAGNRMNAGTSRGNAQAFNLNALRKLSDVKSTDGKTTLLHFVVEEVVRSEGKRCVINRNRSLSRSNSGSLESTSVSKDEKEKLYIKLGLPIVGGISAEFSNVKKAATLDYDSFSKSCSAIEDRVVVIRQIVAQCGSNEQGGFVKEIKGFLDAAEEEIKLVRYEQIRVMELVKRTTEYYQTGASKNKEGKLLQLFVIIKDFLGMVDVACVDVARNLQKKKPLTASGETSSSKSPTSRPSVKFPLLPANFMLDKSKSSSSDSDGEF